MTTVVENIEAGKYDTKLPYPETGTPSEESQEMRKAWRADRYRLQNTLFREDLAKEYGVVGNPKEEKLFRMAWEYGHSSGLREVEMYYEELAELVT